MTVAVLGCVWVLAATACALMPMRWQRYIGLPLLIIAPVLLGAIFVSYGALAFGLALAAFVSMFRRPLVYFWRKFRGTADEVSR